MERGSVADDVTGEIIRQRVAARFRVQRKRIRCAEQVGTARVRMDRPKGVRDGLNLRDTAGSIFEPGFASVLRGQRFALGVVGSELC